MTRIERSVLDRIVPKIDYDNTKDCWEWTGGKNGHGYGYINIDGKMQGLHRLVYEHFCGAVPDGLCLDHLCRNRVCCNPLHLEPVTPAENFRRGVRATNGYENRTHCPQGHEYTEENTYFYLSGRQCRTCVSLRAKSRYYRSKQAATRENDRVI